MRVEHGHGSGHRWAGATTRRERPRTMRPSLAAGMALVALGVALAGCGSSAPTGTNADPAGAVPASTLVYVGAIVRPSGHLKTEALAAGQALTRQHNPYTRLLGALQTPGSPTLDFNRDVAPWLGERAGMFFTALGSSEVLTGVLQQAFTGSGGAALRWPFGTGAGGGAQGAIVLDTRDLAAAQKFVATQAGHAGAHASSYQGVTYQTSAGGDASFAVVARLVVLGTEAGVHAVIDTTRGGASLNSNATYAQLQSVAPAGALGHVYANPAALTGHSANAAGGGSGGGGTQALPELLSVLGGTHPLNVSLVPSAKSLALDADAASAPAGATGGEDGGLITALSTGSRALGELPGEAWLAAGLGNTSGQPPGGAVNGLSGLLSLVSTLASSGGGPPAPSSAQATLSVQGLLEGFLTPLKILGANTAQARRDYRGWMGEVGMFVAGTTVIELKAAAVIDSTDPAASRAAVGKLGSALSKSGAETTPAMIPGTEAAIEAKITGLPVTLVIADGHASNGKTKFVMGLAESSIQAALNPPGTMSGSSAYRAAQNALGEGIPPSLTVNFATLLTLLEGVGLSEDPTITPLVPYLRNSTGVAGGGKSLGGGVQRLRLVLGLQPASAG